MRKILIVSPHLDDAILSVGQFMADRPDAEVITIFAGYPENSEAVSTAYDNKCGFKNAQDAMSVRRRENDEATALLNATAINFDFTDSQYEVEVKTHDIRNALQNLINCNDYEFIMAPLGIGHPDHLKVCEAVMTIDTELPIYLWEDLPLRVLSPELVSERLKKLRISADKLVTHSTTGDKIAKKIRALACYKSQIGTGILDPYIMYVPERLWVWQ